MKKLLLITFLLFLAGMMFAQTQYIVEPTGGTAGNTNGSGADPVCDYYNSMKYQVVYTAAELTASGMAANTSITKLAWNVTELPGTLSNYTIKMGHTTATNSAAHDVNATNIVKTAFTYVPATGYNDIVFDQPFTWNGVSNIVVEIYTGDANPYASPYGGVQAKTGVTAGSRCIRVDGGSTASSNTTTALTTKPYVRFTGNPASSDPAFAVSPTSYDFGSKIIYGTSTNTFNILNIGGGTYNVTSVTISGSPYFSVINVPTLPAAVVPGTPVQFTVQYVPNAVGAHTATVTIVNNLTRTSHEVVVNGSCYNPIIQTLPFTEGFETGNTHNSTTINQWTQARGGTTTYDWTINSTETTYNRTPRTGSFNATLHYSGEAWMFRPVQMVGGTSYDIELYARQDMADTSYAHVGIYFGTEGTITAMTNVVKNMFQTSIINGDYQKVSGSFTPATTGIYYLGIRGKISGTPWYLSVDDITIRETPTLPLAALNTDAKNFGSAVTGSSYATYNFILTNIGQDVLTVDHPSLVYLEGTDAADFTIGELNLPFELTNGQSATIPVVFSPQSAGAKTATIKIESNATNSPIGATLTGTAYDPLTSLNENFDAVTVPALPANWTAFNNSGNTSAYAQTATGGNSTPNNAVIYNAGASTGSIMLVTPGINNLSGKRVKFMSKGGVGFTLSVGTLSNPADPATYTEIQNFTITATYAMYSFNIPTTTNKFIAFKHGHGGTYRSIYVDDVILETPQAVAPNAVTQVLPADNRLLMAAPLLSWTPAFAGEPATGYKVYLSTVQGNMGTMVADVTTTTYQTTGLTAGQTYYWQIAPYNTNGTQMTNTVRQFTMAGALQLVENFELTTLPAGWTADASSWATSTTTPLFDGARSVYVSTGTTALDAATAIKLITPMLAPTNGSYLNFWCRTTATTGNQNIVVKYSTDGTNWTDLNTVTVPYTNWGNLNVDLSSLAGQNYYLAFGAYANASASIYLDYVIGPNLAPVLPNAVTQNLPADLATNVSITPTLTWTPAATGGVPAGYKVYGGLAADQLQLITAVTTTSFTVPAGTPLPYSTTYYWQIVATNSTGDSQNNTTRSFTTIPDPTIYTFPHTQDFATYPPTNWTEAKGQLAAPTTMTATSSVWGADGFANNGTTGAAGINIYSTGRFEWMITPPIYLDNNPDGYQLEFDLALTDYANANPITSDPAGTTGVDDKFAVVISTDNGVTWTSANTLRLWDNATSPYVYNNISATGDHITIPLTGYTGFLKIGFYGESTVANADNDLFIDNVKIGTIPTAPIFAITPDAQNFGNVLINTTEEQLFTVRNEGTGTLVVNSVEITGNAAFSLSELATYPVSLTNLQATTFKVVYNPTTAGTHEAVVTVTDNLTRTAHTVNISAVSVDPTIVSLPKTFDFSEAPVGWSEFLTGEGVTQRWGISATNNAGGTANELVGQYQNINPATSLLRLPLINVTNTTSIDFKFKTKFDDYGDGMTAKVVMSTDGSTWTDLWSMASGAGDFIGNVSVTFAYTAPTYIGFVIDGNLYQFDGWFIDDIEIIKTPVYNPPVNLAGTVDGNDVTLTWDTPNPANSPLFAESSFRKNVARKDVSRRSPVLSRDLTGYKVYRDTTLIATLANNVLTYDDMDVAEGTYTYSVKALYGENMSVAATVEVTVTGGLVTQNIQMTAGWNTISANVMPENADIEAIFTGLANSGDLVKVIDEGGFTFEDLGGGFWYNGIGLLTATEGYSVYVNNDCSLVLQGTPVALPLTIPLMAGWNLISYPMTSETNAEALFTDLVNSGALVKVIDNLGFTFEDLGGGFWYNGIGDGVGNLIPGNGYYVYVNEDCTLTYTNGSGAPVRHMINNKKVKKAVNNQ